jgi:hypothetical protein
MNEDEADKLCATLEALRVLQEKMEKDEEQYGYYYDQV